jgi:hypothetical protein
MYITFQNSVPTSQKTDCTTELSRAQMLAARFPIGYLLVLLIGPQDGSSKFLRYADKLLPDYTAIYTSRYVFFIGTAVRTSNPTTS